MSEANKSPVEAASAKEGKPANPGRRRLGSLGAGGSIVALSVTSKSAVAGWGSCSKSELASSALSREVNDANPCGCSPGAWWKSPKGTELWSGGTVPAFASFPPTAMFNTVFGRNLLNPYKALSAVGPCSSVSYTLSNLPASTAQHLVAGLLNAGYYGDRYPPAGLSTPGAIISAFQAAFDAPANSRVSLLKALVAKLDVYASARTWCLGDQH